MKRQAEEFLLYHCPSTIPVILRPAFVWHEQERGWTVPIALANNLGHSVRENIVKNLPGGDYLKQLFPQSSSIHLDTLTEYAIRGALGQLDGKNDTHIWTNDMMNN